MTWFKVDDGLHSHKKAVRAGVPAMGLWVMAGSWCADNLSDGWLPDYIASRLDRDFEQNAKTLVQVGLWVEETRDGEPGWSFHEWGEPGRQPSREQVLTERAANADRQKRARDRAKEKREREEEERSRRESRPRNGVTNGVSNAAVTGAVTVPPTRPDPTRPKVPTEPKTLPADAGGSQQSFDGMPDPPEPDHPVKANDITAAFVDACRAFGQDDPTTSIIKRVARDAKRLLETEKVPGEKLLAAADFIAGKGWQSLESGLRHLAAQDNGPPENHNGAGYRSAKHQTFQNPPTIAAYHGEL